MRRADLRAAMVRLALVAGVVGCREERSPPVAEQPVEDSTVAPVGARALPGEVNAELAARGRQPFALTCMVCHGPDAAGTQLGPSLVDDEWLSGTGEFAEIQRVIVDGVAEPEEFPIPMPPMGGGVYTAEEVRAMAAYVYSLGV
ncbi:MAG: cytochrome c [Gemmatimonadota bacterium]|nr:cytochrome c [Gemmatimonadota bacterium]